MLIPSTRLVNTGLLASKIPVAGPSQELAGRPSIDSLVRQLSDLEGTPGPGNYKVPSEFGQYVSSRGTRPGTTTG